MPMVIVSLAAIMLAIVCAVQCVQLYNMQGRGGGARGSRKGKRSRAHRPLAQASDDEDDDYEAERALDCVAARGGGPAAQDATEDLRSDLIGMQQRVGELEGRCAAMALQQEQQQRAMLAQKEEQGRSVSRLLDEMCEVVQRELATETNSRRDAVLELKAQMAALAQQHQIKYVNL